MVASGVDNIVTFDSILGNLARSIDHSRHPLPQPAGKPTVSEPESPTGFYNLFCLGKLIFEIGIAAGIIFVNSGDI